MIAQLGAFLTHLPLGEPIAIVGHVRPDGDALGSMFGLGSLLKKRGHTVAVILPGGRPPEYLRILPNLPTFDTFSAACAQHKIQKIIALDTANYERLNMGEKMSRETLDIPIYVIDHHFMDNQNYGLENFVMKAAATAEIITLAAVQEHWHIDGMSSTALLAGILRDTGCFKFGNTSPSALRMVATLMECDAAYTTVIEDLWFSRHLKQVQGETDILLNHTFFHVDGRIAIICATREVLDSHGITLDSSDDLLDQVRSILGVEIVVFLMDVPAGTKVSMRSKHATWPVGPTARRLGGGGHDMAASAIVPFTPFEILAERVVSELLKDRENVS